MTWRELKRKIEVMPAEQLDKEVKCWGEDISISSGTLDVCDENMYYNSDWDGYACPESDLDKESIEDPYTELLAKKGGVVFVDRLKQTLWHFYTKHL